MDQQEIRAYVETFFTLRGCRLIEKKEDFITVELNPETDQDLGYRPFYWTYVNNLGLEPQLLQKTYIFRNPGQDGEVQGEHLLFGSPRLRQIFAAALKRGQFVRLYETRHEQQGMHSYTPWLLINYKIEYKCDKKKEKMLSIGCNLVTGEIWKEFYRFVETLSLTPQLPAYVFIQPPLFSFENALNRIESLLEQMIGQEDHSWAKDALNKYEEEKAQIVSYYEQIMEQFRKRKAREEELSQAVRNWEAEKAKRLEELEWQYKPRVEVKTVNQGFFYLRSHPSQMSNSASPPPLYLDGKNSDDATFAKNRTGKT